MKYAFCRDKEIRELQDALGIPGAIQSITIKLLIDDFVMIDCTFGATEAHRVAIKKYLLAHKAEEVVE